MFGWAVAFLLLAIVAGIFGFAGMAGTGAWVAKLLFGIGAGMFLLLLLLLLASGRRPPDRLGRVQPAGRAPAARVFPGNVLLSPPPDKLIP